MEVVSPMWIGFKNTKVESMSFSARGDNDVFVKQTWHQTLMDTSGEEVPGAHHILEIQMTYAYTNGKISQLVQEFNAAKVEASRRLATEVAELTMGMESPK